MPLNSLKIDNRGILILKPRMTLLILCFMLIKKEGITQDSTGQIFIQKISGRNHDLYKRKLALASVQTSLWTASLISLDKTWYSKYKKSTFHSFNDWNEWQQMDKLGHMYSAFIIQEHTTKIWEWSGTDKKKSIIIGGLSSLVFLNAIELLDAHSAKWGFSTTDIVANFMGVGIYTTQALAWKDQRIRLKFSYHKNHYDDLRERANELFGNGSIERVLKDYNGQTYWASANLKSFFPHSKLPAWLCLSIGYGSDNMLGGFKNEWTYNSGVAINRFDLQRNRKYLFSLDMDLSKLKTKNRVLKTFLSTFNTLKIPAPTIIFNSKGKPATRLFYF